MPSVAQWVCIGYPHPPQARPCHPKVIRPNPLSQVRSFRTLFRRTKLSSQSTFDRLEPRLSTQTDYSVENLFVMPLCSRKFVFTNGPATLLVKDSGLPTSLAISTRIPTMLRGAPSADEERTLYPISATNLLSRALRETCSLPSFQAFTLQPAQHLLSFDTRKRLSSPRLSTSTLAHRCRLLNPGRCVGLGRTHQL
jgi:hypothetical protein